ncbi:hypothetical protein RDABS01_002696 [Bienertia sinuspersici]
MKSINFPNFTNSFNLTPPISTNNLSFPSSHSHISAKTLNSPLLLALCTRNPHTQNHSDSTFDENPNFKSNSNPIDPQKNHSKPTYSSRNLQSNPTKSSSKGLIFDAGENGCWDSIEIGSPVVKRFLGDEQERWYMWYYGTSEKQQLSGSIGLAVSSNGVHWERGEQAAASSSSGTGVVMTCGEDWWAFDTKCIRPSEVMIMSSTKVRASSAVYWLYYTGFSSESVEMSEPPEDCCFHFAENGLSLGPGLGRVLKTLPGLAISQDGRNWARIEGDHHSGALFDVGSEGEWDSLFIASPHVVFHSNGDLRMYYHSFDAREWRFSIGIARSRDGIKWVKLGKIMTIMGQGSSSDEGCFDEMGAVNACVVRDNKVGNYLMAYEGIARDGKRGIGIAVSEDGLKDWRRVSDKEVIVASSDDLDGWDCTGVGYPCLVQMDGDEDQWRLYYTGFGAEGRTGIGMAVSQKSDITSFRRWTGFHL